MGEPKPTGDDTQAVTRQRGGAEKEVSSVLQLCKDMSCVLLLFG